MKLPTVSGANLSRQTLTFPNDFSSAKNLVFIAFQQWQQKQVDSWVPLAEQLRQREPSFDYYEFPTIQKMNLLARAVINEGMRAGIPNTDTRRRTITLYINKQSFRQALNIPNEKEIGVYLFNRQGDTLWHTFGSFTSEKGEALKIAVATCKQLLTSP